MFEDIQDSVVAYHFKENFARRYEPRHPEFFLGLLEDAIKEVRSKQSRRCVYKNYFSSIFSIMRIVFHSLVNRASSSLFMFITIVPFQALNFSCPPKSSEVLCSDPVVSFFKSNFIVCGWDLTTNANQERYIESLFIILYHSRFV